MPTRTLDPQGREFEIPHGLERERTVGLKGGIVRSHINLRVGKDARSPRKMDRERSYQ